MGSFTGNFDDVCPSSYKICPVSLQWYVYFLGNVSIILEGGNFVRFVRNRPRRILPSTLFLFRYLVYTNLFSSVVK